VRRELEREDEGATERGQKYEEEKEKGERRKSWTIKKVER